jgi:uncharacterized Fe-S cluster protein YjdI
MPLECRIGVFRCVSGDPSIFQVARVVYTQPDRELKT